MKNLSRLAFLMLALSLCFVNCKKEDIDTFVPEPAQEEDDNQTHLHKNAAEFVEEATEYSLFYQAMVKAEMMETLRDEDQQFTIFAPSNEAFQKLLDENDSFDSLEDISESTMRLLMKYHITTTGKIMAEDFEDNLAIKILYQDRLVYIKMPSADKHQITTGGFSIADIQTTDALTKNAVIHLIDKVLVP